MAIWKKKEKEKMPKEKGIKKYINTVWLVAAVFSFFFLLGTAFGHIDELNTRQLAHSIEAKYIDDGNSIYAEYYDENNVLHTYNLNGHDPVHDGDRITLYYTTNVDDAIQQNTAVSWLLYYLVFGGIFALSMWQLKKITHGSGRA